MCIKKKEIGDVEFVIIPSFLDIHWGLLERIPCRKEGTTV